MPSNQGPSSPISNLKGKKVPGGKSQSGGKANPTFDGGTASPRLGKGRGILGSGTPDVLGRSPGQQDRSAGGNYGGGFASQVGKKPAGRKRR